MRTIKKPKKKLKPTTSTGESSACLRSSTIHCAFLRRRATKPLTICLCSIRKRKRVCFFRSTSSVWANSGNETEDEWSAQNAKSWLTVSLTTSYWKGLLRVSSFFTSNLTATPSSSVLSCELEEEEVFPLFVRARVAKGGRWSSELERIYWRF